MRKLQRWVMLHQRLAVIILSVIYVCGISAFLEFQIPSWIVIVVLGILYFFSLLLIPTAINAWINEPLKTLFEQCDPYPLLREIHGIPMEKLSPQLRQTMTINYCVGLHNIGNYELAFATLSAFNIDNIPGVPPVTKVVYYNNLCAVCCCLEKFDEAEIWYTKMMHIYDGLPDNKLKKNLESAVLSTRIEHHCYAGEYEKALEILSTEKPKNRIGEVGLHMHLAVNYLALGKKDLARENLQFVIENGNKLYAVTKAKEILARLDAE